MTFRLRDIAQKIVDPAIRRILKGSRRSRVLILSDKGVLLVSERFGPGGWSLPGGGLKRSENDKASARREIYEELKITLTDDDLIQVLEWTMGDQGFEFEVVAFAANVDSKVTIKKSWLEIEKFRWFALDSLPEGRSKFIDIVLEGYQSNRV